VLQLRDLVERIGNALCWRVKMALANKGLPFDAIPWRFAGKAVIAFSGPSGRISQAATLHFQRTRT
jgi:hypothetical protein